LGVSLLLMTVGNGAMWVIPVVLPVVQKDFGVGRAEAALPYTLMMLGFGLGGIIMGRLADRFGLFVPLILAAFATGSGFMLAGMSTGILGFALALGVNQVGQRWRPIYISASLLPFIITPVVGALAIKWLFRDNGLVPYFLSQFGISLFWMAQAWSARLLIILYGIWHVVPFAFIVFYAGLQSVPQDSLEAARIDGANAWQRLIYVTLPHLAPLFVFVTLIHLMDAYRVFEPVMVLTQGAFTTSVQYLTYYILLQENNPYKASAAAVLTTAGIAVLLIPLLVRTWKEQRRGG
jgi:ABC-type sugar transport system permease subunit